MKLFGKDLERELVVVAEIGVNHEGSADAAQRLYDLAADAGADAVKLQTYTPERYASSSDPKRLERVTRFSLDEGAHRRLAEHAARRGVPLFSTALTEDVVPFLAQWCPAIKIASGDLTFEPVIRASAATGKPVILSTGNGTVEEIDVALSWLGDEIGIDSLKERVVLMHCVSAYPVPIDQANVLSVPFLRQRYGLTTGYSNHVVEPEAMLAAVALGAQVMEVHVTDLREGREFRDHSLSFEPGQLRELVRGCRRVKASLGLFGKTVQDCERPIREATRKGVVAARDLAAGTVLRAEDLMYARPASEIPAGDLHQVVGRTLARSLGHGELVSRRDLK